jgi:hypothetical protein
MSWDRERLLVTHSSKAHMCSLLLTLLGGNRIWFGDLAAVLGLTATSVCPEGLNIAPAGVGTFQIKLSCSNYETLIEWLDKHHKPYGDTARAAQVQWALQRPTNERIK